ncbi:MAG: hypothetical protein MUO99_08040 [Dehalococcoidales bacterium]|nr:hypothetical protein [Dehalococcoidales bacterium]
MVNISLVLLSLGLSLMVLGVRFVMVRNSLRVSKPSDERLKLLKKEWLYLLPAGFIVFLIGFFSPHFKVSVEEARNLASTGGVLFVLGIPQFSQWKLGRGTEEKVRKSAEQLKKLAWVIAVIGFILALVSPFV